MGKIEEIITKYKELKYNNRILKPEHEAMTWFLFRDYLINRCMVGIDRECNIIILYTDQDMFLNKQLLYNEYIDYSYIPNHIILTEKTPKYMNLELGIFSKFHTNDYTKPNDAEQDIILKALDLIELTYIKYSNRLNRENKDYFHYVTINKNDLTLYSKKIPHKRSFVWDDTKYPDLVLTNINIKDAWGGLKAFLLEIPVLSRKRNKVINPYLVVLESKELDQEYYFILDCETKELPYEVMNILNNMPVLPNKLAISSGSLIYPISETIKDKISIKAEPLDPVLFLDTYDALMSLIYDNREYLESVGYIEMEDLKDGFKEISDLNRFIHLKFPELEQMIDMDDYLLQSTSTKYYDLFMHYYRRNLEEPLVLVTYFYYLSKQFYYLIPDFYYEDEEQELEDNSLNYNVS